MTTKVITIVNQKGGVGKTTTAVSLAHGLALKKKNVLLIDLDPQGNAAIMLGLRPEAGAYYLLTMGQAPNETAFVRQYVRNTGRECLWLIASDQMTNAAQTVLNANQRPVSAIRDALNRFTMRGGGLDCIVLDTAPSVGGIQERAIWAANLVVVTSSTEYLSTNGVRETTEMMVYLQKEKGWNGSFLCVLPTFYHDQLREHRASLADLQAGFGDRVLPPIHRATVLSECPGEAKTIFEKDPDGRSAKEYQVLVDFVLKH